MKSLSTNAGERFAILLPPALISALWLPPLLQGRLIIHGDSAHHGLPLLKLLGEAMAGKESLLWSSRIYGGHPLLAESQGGFVEPLNILAAGLFEPALALGVFHWLAMLVSAFGVFALCRLLDISRWSAAFAATAVSFSGSWIHARHNLPISASLAWLPWLLATTEYWLRRPSIFRASLLALPAALLVFSGYPQIAHGAAIYAIVSLSGEFFGLQERSFILRHGRALLGTGLLAIALATGLAALQLLPLTELIGQSHRSHGTDLAFNGLMPPFLFLRGLLFYYFGTEPEGINTPTLASITLFSLSGLLLFVRPSTRILGHALATFLLLNLALGALSPLFHLLYDHAPVLGLHYYRIMTPFFAHAVIGFCVIAAFMLDTLAGNIRERLWPFCRRYPASSLAAAAILAGGLIIVCRWLDSPLYSPWNYIAPAMLLAFTLLLTKIGRQRWLPLCAALILAIDVLFFRMHAMNFFDRSVLAPPDIVHAIAAEPDHPDFRVMDSSTGGMMSLLGPTDPTLAFNYRRLLTALSPFPMALQWKVPSINGVLALPLSRRVLLDPVLEAEVAGTSKTRPGQRLIDSLGVRYVSRDAPLANPSLMPYAQDREHGIFIYRNPSAKPRFRIYADADVRSVRTPEQALAGMQTAGAEALFIETDARENPASAAPCPACAAAQVEIVEASDTLYQVKVDVPQDAWLFLADANYPGWQATVNGVQQTVYSAQVLGKAVRLKAGRNDVAIRFESRSFRLGAAISALSLLLVLAILAGHFLVQRRTPERSAIP